MSKNLLVSSLLGAVIGIAPSAHANGFPIMDGQWFNTRLKATIKKNHSIDDLNNTVNTNKAKFDSGKNSCYSQFHATSSVSIDILTVCENASSGWEKAFNKVTKVDLLDDGNVGNFSRLLSLPSEGGGYDSDVWGGYFGTLIFNIKYNSDNSEIRSVKFVNSKDGATDYSDFIGEI